MRIARVQVEEGFLDGLDLQFTGGLNTVIGARGSGKTSLIEIIRYCLGVQGSTDEFTLKSLSHARAILGSGQVTVTLESQTGDEAILVTRSGNADAPRSSANFSPPLIFSQTEVESLGLSATGRLQLIDGFSQETAKVSSAEVRAASKIRSLSMDISAELREIEQLEREIVILPDIERQIKELAPNEKAVADASAEAAAKSEQLKALSEHLAKLSVRQTFAERFSRPLKRWRSLIGETHQLAVELMRLHQQQKDSLKKSVAAVLRAVDLAEKLDKELDNAEKTLADEVKGVDAERNLAEGSARELRRAIEQIRTGAGAIARQAQSLKERKAQIASLQSALDDRRKVLGALTVDRERILDQLDSIREKRFEARRNTALKLTTELAPRIKVEITRGGRFDSYTNVLIAMLRGSGIRYNDLAPEIARQVSPRELVEWVEKDDVQSLAEACLLPLRI